MLAYNQFVRAVAAGNTQAVVDMLTEGSRRHMKQAGLTGELSDGLTIRPGWQFELDIPSSARGEMDSTDASRALVTGPLEGGIRTIPMVLEEGVWRVDLLSAEMLEVD